LDFVIDAVVAVVVVAIIVASGGTALGAWIAIASVAGGALAASAAMAVFQGGSFWENLEKNFHTNFRIGAAMLAGSAIYADIFGGGVAEAGGHNGLQGFVRSNSSTVAGRSNGLTIGSAAFYDNAEVASHEFGHTLQFIGLSAVMGLNHSSNWDVWRMYLSLGVAGAIPYLGVGWEAGASAIGAAAW
jgi:hypothetical protein